GGCEDAPRPMSRSPQAKADYGVDDPRVPIVLALSGTASVAIAAVSWAFEFVPGIVVFGLAGLSGVVGAAGYMYATLRGKHRAWARHVHDRADSRRAGRAADLLPWGGPDQDRRSPRPRGVPAGDPRPGRKPGDRWQPGPHLRQ